LNFMLEVEDNDYFSSFISTILAQVIECVKNILHKCQVLDGAALPN